ncbi:MULTISPECIES: AMP-binding protein [unclassified Acinetobacter]|uniref:AMP-binding protein n=1 Tax=unclassified Acinetobacter TaxID=196816 RepID=UPI0035BB12FD
MDRVWLDTFKEYGIEKEIFLPSENTSLIDIFEKSLKQFASQDAFVFMDKAITYAELDQYSLSFATYLQSLGLGKGSRVALMMPNILQNPIAILGIIRSGCVLVNVNPLYTTRELEHQLKDSGAEVLVTVDRFAHVFEPIQDKTPVKKVIVTGIGDMLGFLKGNIVNFVLRHVRKEVPAWNITNALDFKDALSKSASSYKRPTISLSDTAVLQYTGGTTGVSKGAELTHRNLIANMLQVNSFFESRFGKNATLQGEYFACALPLYHIFSFTVCGLYGMYKGASNVLIANPRDLPALVKDLEKYRPALFPAVNTLFNAVVHHKDFQKLDHSNLKVAIGGGMSVLAATASKWKEVTGVSITEGYGLSETSPLVTVNPPTRTEFSGMIGIPAPQTDVILLDEEGNDVTGQVDDKGEPVPGEIAVRGPQVMKGYWNRPDETEKVMTKDGFFRTGDMGIMDEKGYFKIVDRKKDMILVSGFNVYPNEIEEVVASHPKVLEVAAIGVPDDKSGEVPKLFIVKKDASLTAEEILAYAKENLTGYKRPRYVEFMTELPKSNVGKILRKDLRNK